MAGINKRCGSALTKIGAVANRYTVLLEMISDHDGADNPERGAIRADLFLLHLQGASEPQIVRSS